MKKVSDGFKTNIKLTGRQLDFKMYLYNNYNLATENGDLLLTEDNINLASEQFKLDDKTEIGSESIYSASINRNGSLFKSLMKELDFEADKDFSIGSMVDFQFGLLVNGEYEYIDYGNYVIYSKEYKLDTETWSYVCYDRMLYYMIKYSKLDITYPITIRDYIENLAHKMTLGFADSETEFTNYNELINEDLFKDKDYTYRDILDKLSEITASNIMLDEQDRLKIGYPSETDTSLDESDLKDINVAFGENFGVINRISITDSDVDVEYYAEDSDSITKNGKTQINIVDNEFTTNGNQTKMAQTILKRLNGFYYSINDFSTIGTCIYDYLDMFNVNAKGNTYKCLVLNDEIDFSQGIKESFYTEKLENSEKESGNYQTSTMSSKTVTFKINQQEGKIESKVEKDGVISAINQSPEEVQINANKISLEGKKIDLTTEDISIESSNFSLTSEGRITTKEGQIGGFTLNKDSFTSPIYPRSTNASGETISIKIPTNEEINEIRHIIDGNKPTQDQLERLDFNNDGEIDIADYAIGRANQIYNVDNENPGKLMLNTTSGGNVITLYDKDEVERVQIGLMGLSIQSQSLDATDKNTYSALIHANEINIGKEYVNTDGAWIHMGVSQTDQSADISISSGSSSGTGNVNIDVDANNGSSMSLDGPVYATAFNNTSLEESKKNIKKSSIKALNIIKNTDIYDFNYKQEKDGYKKHIGFVIGEKYNYSKDITNQENTGVDLYSMVSVAYKAIQEQQEEIEELKKRIEKLEVKNG